MKKIIFILFLFFMVGIVKAEQFTIGDYIEGEHIKMVSKEKTKTLTIQKILDSNGRFVYCLEPFILVDEVTTDYNVFVKDLSGYKNLTEEQKRKVSLIAFYGYGFSNRMTDVWYAATQMLIWKTVDPDSEFYFTDTLGGEKISKHIGRMNDILADVEYHDDKPNFIKDYVVNYKDDLVITNYDYKFKIDTEDYDYIYDPSSATITVKDVINDGSFTFEKNIGKYNRDVTIYSNDNSQDLIRPGNVVNTIYTINVNVTKGNISFLIKDDESDIYSRWSSLNNTCYELYKEDEVIDKVCVKKGGFLYKTSSLPYGNYKVKQVSVGVGYEVDEKVYDVFIDEDTNPTLILNNYLIKNKIELNKYYCYNKECLSEENAVFKVYDSEGFYVGKITTDSNGYGYIDVGYGLYTIEQDDGIDNYTFVDSYTVNVLNSSDKYHTDLYNYYIEEETNEFDKEDSEIDIPNDDLELEDPPKVEVPSNNENLKEDIVIPENGKDEVIKEEILPDEEIIEDSKDEVIVVPDKPVLEDVTLEDVTDKVVDEDVVEQPTDDFEDNKEEIGNVLPPLTGTKLADFIKILYNVIIVIICCCKLKRFCYNN